MTPAFLPRAPPGWAGAPWWEALPSGCLPGPKGVEGVVRVTAWAGASVPPGVPPACPGTATASQCPAVRGGHPRSTWPAGLAVLWACTFICSTRDRSRFCLLPQVSRQQGEPRSSGSLDGETAAGPQQPGAAAGKGRKVLLPSWLGARTSHTTAGEFPSPPHAPGHSGPCHV